MSRLPGTICKGMSLLCCANPPSTSFAHSEVYSCPVQYKLWVKPAGEMSFLYGNHVVKAHLGRITENTPKYQGVVVYSMSDIPLGTSCTLVGW